MKNIAVYLLSIAVLLSLFSCTGIYEDGHELANDKIVNISQISIDDLKSKIKNDEDFLLIDVRQLKESEKEQIEEAILIPRGTIEFEIANKDFWEEQSMNLPSKESTEIIIYCKSGMRGILTVETLMQLGYENVKNLEGGYVAFNEKPDASN
jgi:rhodanese-related sulfurtransferase